MQKIRDDAGTLRQSSGGLEAFHMTCLQAEKIRVRAGVDGRSGRLLRLQPSCNLGGS